MADDTSETSTPAPKPATRRRTTRTAGAAKSTVKKAPTKSAAKPASTAASPTTKRRTAPAKPRAAKRATPAPARRAPASRPAASAEKQADKGKWTAAAIAGGLAAAGAVGAALLSLRGSTPKPKKAHAPDGRDASKSFSAGIADENTIPDKS